MVLNLITEKSSLLEAINRFSENYHLDFFSIKHFAAEYKEKPSLCSRFGGELWKGSLRLGSRQTKGSKG